jgi:hypothetical protein
MRVSASARRGTRSSPEAEAGRRLNQRSVALCFSYYRTLTHSCTRGAMPLVGAASSRAMGSPDCGGARDSVATKRLAGSRTAPNECHRRHSARPYLELGARCPLRMVANQGLGPCLVHSAGPRRQQLSHRECLIAGRFAPTGCRDCAGTGSLGTAGPVRAHGGRDAGRPAGVTDRATYESLKATHAATRGPLPLCATYRR